MQDTGIPSYPFAKVGLDLSGPYPIYKSGNMYNIAFFVWLTIWPEAFSVPEKSAHQIVYLLVEEIFPRYGSPLDIVTDSGSENINRALRHTIDELNIDHVNKNLILSPTG